MAAVSDNMRTTKSRRQRKPKVGDMDSTVEIALQPEVLKTVTDAATAGGQTVSEWIHEAVVEAIERRSALRRFQPVPEQ